MLQLYVQLSEVPLTPYGNFCYGSISQLDKNDWIRKAEISYEKTNFPLCIGALDGKHIRIRKTNESGSPFFSYKIFFSTVLLAVADEDYSFISVEVGDYGSSSDSNVFYKLDIWEITGEQETEYSRPQVSAQRCRRIIHVICACR